MSTDRREIDLDQVARLIWITLNDQRETGTFGYQSTETRQPYLKAAAEIADYLADLDADAGGEPSGERLMSDEREDATAARAVWDTLNERDRDFWRDRVRAGPHNPQESGD